MSNITKNVATSQQLNIKDKKKENKISIQEKKMTNVANLSELKPAASNNKNEQSKYYYDQDSLMFRNGDEDPTLVSKNYIEVIALSRDEYRSKWRVHVKIKNRDRDYSELGILQSTLLEKKETFKLLVDEGFPLDGLNEKTETQILKYLKEFVPDERRIYRSSPGWLDSENLQFVCPSFQYTVSDEIYCFDDLSEFGYAIDKSKSLEKWQDNVEMDCQGNHTLVFCLCVALAGILSEFVPDIGTTTFHLYGKSSTGKTTTLKIACSIWGDPDLFLLGWNATKNGLEAAIAAHNNTFAAFDEASQASANVMDMASYMAGNSRGKIRMKADSTLRQTKKWHTMMLSSGEVTIAEKIEEEGRKAKVGQSIRFPGIYVNGVLDDLHGLGSGVELVKRLNKNISEYHGTAAKAFVGRLIDKFKTRTALKNAIDQILDTENQRILEKFNLKGAHGQVHRMANLFSLVSTAGLLCAGLNVFKYIKHEEVQKFVDSTFDDLLSGRGNGAMEDSNIPDKTLDWLLLNDARFINWVYPDSKVSNALGYKRIWEDGDKSYYISPTLFDDELCKRFIGIGKKIVRNALKEKDILDDYNNGQNKIITLPDGQRRKMVTLNLYQKNPNLNFEQKVQK